MIKAIFSAIVIAFLLITNKVFAMSWQDFQKLRQDEATSQEVKLRNAIYLLGIRDGIVGYNRSLDSIDKEKLYCFPNEMGNVDVLLISMENVMADMKQRALIESALPNPIKMEVSDVMAIALLKYVCKPVLKGSK